MDAFKRAKEIIEEAIEYSDNGNWIIPYNEYDDSIMIGKVAYLISKDKRVACVDITDEGYDIIIYLDYLKNEIVEE